MYSILPVDLENGEMNSISEVSKRPTVSIKAEHYYVQTTRWLWIIVYVLPVHVITL